MSARGEMLNTSLLDYRMPVTLDLPMIDTVIVEVASPSHPYGARGVGEISIVPPPAAIANAIYGATGSRLRELPMGPCLGHGGHLAEREIGVGFWKGMDSRFRGNDGYAGASFRGNDGYAGATFRGSDGYAGATFRRNGDAARCLRPTWPAPPAA